MSRLVDADKLNLFEEDGKVHRYCFPCIEIIRLIDEAPTVRTKQIKFYDEDESVWKIGEVIIDE